MIRKYWKLFAPLFFALILLSLPPQQNLALLEGCRNLFHRSSFDAAESLPDDIQAEVLTAIPESDSITPAELLAYLKESSSLFYGAEIAKVVARRETSWNSFLWIESDQPLQLGSPVTYGNILLGSIDYVQGCVSRVRLIFDPSLTVAIRAKRGSHSVFHHIQQLQLYLKTHPSFLEKIEHQTVLESLLERSLQNLTTTPDYLAKGELAGLSLSATGEPILQGKGFQYEFSDEHGPARDLRTGEIKESDLKKTTSNPLQPILMPHDQIITSGLDGLFPEGLEVGEVTTISSLEEGATSYRIEALPYFSPLRTPRWVTVLSPPLMIEVAEPTKEGVLDQLLEELDPQLQ